jgi:hypothetical protein
MGAGLQFRLTVADEAAFSKVDMRIAAKHSHHNSAVSDLR